MRKKIYRIFNLGSWEEGEIGSESREKGVLPPCSSPLGRERLIVTQSCPDGEK